MPRKGRMEDKVERKTIPIPKGVAARAATVYNVAESGCWVSAYFKMPSGYAQVSHKDPVTGRRMAFLAHRAAYTHHNGPIPQGLVIDHRCFNRGCVNPDHLRAITARENTQRAMGFDSPLGTCKHGHDDSHMVLKHFPSRDQWMCQLCFEDRNRTGSQWRSALRRLEYAYGIRLTRRQQAMVDEFVGTSSNLETP